MNRGYKTCYNIKLSEHNKCPFELEVGIRWWEGLLETILGKIFGLMPAKNQCSLRACKNSIFLLYLHSFRKSLVGHKFKLPLNFWSSLVKIRQKISLTDTSFSNAVSPWIHIVFSLQRTTLTLVENANKCFYFWKLNM